MQQSLNIFELYCDLWKLDVNINRTNGMVFSKEKNLNYSFILQDKQLEASKVLRMMCVDCFGL
jgi:hypothetical protein